MTDDDETELRQLCAEYKTACLAVCKALNVGRPPEADKVALFQQADANAAAVLERIRTLLGVSAAADAA